MAHSERRVASAILKELKKVAFKEQISWLGNRQIRLALLSSVNPCQILECLRSPSFEESRMYNNVQYV